VVEVAAQGARQTLGKRQAETGAGSAAPALCIHSSPLFLSIIRSHPRILSEYFSFRKPLLD
jgi:hypothetical protein